MSLVRLDLCRNFGICSHNNTACLYMALNVCTRHTKNPRQKILINYSFFYASNFGCSLVSLLIEKTFNNSVRSKY